MTLSQRITDLAQALARELKARAPSDHPGVARAWVCFADVSVNTPGSTPMMLSSFNVAAVECIARGKYRVLFDTPMVDTHYCWQVQAHHSSWWFWFKPRPARLQLVTKTPHSIELSCRNAIGLSVAACEMSLTVWR